MAICKKCGGNILEDLGICEVCGYDGFDDDSSDMFDSIIEDKNKNTDDYDWAALQKRLSEIEDVDNLNDDERLDKKLAEKAENESNEKELAAIFSEIDFSLIEDEEDDIDELEAKKIINNLNIPRYEEKDDIKERFRRRSEAVVVNPKDKKAKKKRDKKLAKDRKNKEKEREEREEKEEKDTSKNSIVTFKDDESASNEHLSKNNEEDSINSLSSKPKKRGLFGRSLKPKKAIKDKDFINEIEKKYADELKGNEGILDSLDTDDFNAIDVKDNNSDVSIINISDKLNNISIDDIKKDIGDIFSEDDSEALVDFDEIDHILDTGELPHSDRSTNQSTEDMDDSRLNEIRDEKTLNLDDNVASIGNDDIVAVDYKSKFKERAKVSKKKDNIFNKLINKVVDIFKDSDENNTPKNGILHKIFGNVQDAKYEKKLEKLDKQDKEKLKKKQQREADKKVIAEQKKEANKKIQDTKAQAKKNEKALAAEKKKKRQAAKERKALADTEKEPKTRINKLGATVVFTFFGLIAFLTINGSEVISYNDSITKVEKLYDKGDYGEAYTLLSGMKLKEEDEKIYNRLRLIESLNNKLSYSDSYIIINRYPEALNALLDAINTYEDNVENAKKLGIEEVYNSIYSNVELTLNERFAISIDDAKKVANILDKTEYTLRVNEICKGIEAYNTISDSTESDSINAVDNVSE